MKNLSALQTHLRLTVNLRLVRRALGLSLVLMLIGVFMGCHQLPLRNRLPFGKRLPFGDSVREVQEIEPAVKHHSLVYDSSFRTNYPKRVVIVASGRNVANYESNQRLIQELASSFRSAGLFEVVAPSGVLLYGHSDNILKGRYEEREIARITRDYNADCVAIVRVNDLRAHAPIRASATIAFVDGNESITFCGVDGVWDLGLPASLNAFEEYMNLFGGVVDNGLHQKSPNALFRFLSYEVASSLQEVTQP